ncbi:hypothetical protein GQ55_2G460500 [Panicum hallii var. hallii]|uniref:Uncharacterized protein n=1 Tax=Panicum hallii var. hallii TaxID=1504633 RepID=A0A2T7EZL6_9POAL|nr:hypothetical protein GQ55_2G460500 [Panicum hallii var. hallii]
MKKNCNRTNLANWNRDPNSWIAQAQRSPPPVLSPRPEEARKGKGNGKPSAALPHLPQLAAPPSLASPNTPRPSPDSEEPSWSGSSPSVVCVFPSCSDPEKILRPPRRWRSC